MDVLTDIRKLTEPVLLHAVTQKGKGYAPAEADARALPRRGQKFHPRRKHLLRRAGELLCAEGARDERLVCVTAAMADGVGLSGFAKTFPQRFFDVGICEEYAVTMAAGMAKGGMRPVVCLYATFFERALDEVLHDVCLQNLPVLFCVDRAGFVGADGKTHQAYTTLRRCAPCRTCASSRPRTARNLRSSSPMRAH